MAFRKRKAKSSPTYNDLFINIQMELEDYKNVLLALKHWMEKEHQVIKPVSKKMAAAFNKVEDKIESLETSQECLSGFINLNGYVGYEGRINREKDTIVSTLLDCGEYEKALFLCQSIRKDCEEKYHGIGRIFIETERFKEAEQILNEGLQKFPDSIMLLIGMGVLFHKTDDFHNALECYERALQVEPANEDVLFNKSSTLYWMNRYEEAHKILLELIWEYPDEPMYLTSLGYCYLNMERPEEAAIYFRRVVYGKSKSANAYNGLFCAYNDMHLLNDAEEIAREGLREFPDDDPLMYSNLGLACFELGQIMRATDITNKGLEKFPKDECLRNLQEMIEEESFGL